MSIDNTRLIAAIDRNFAEINNAILKLKAYNSLCASNFSHAGMSFFFIAHQALFNDMIANAIRVLDKHKDAASLWYIIKCNEAVSKKIVSVQRTHPFFAIDRKGNNSSRRLFGHVGNFSKVSVNHANGSKPFNLAVANKL